MGDIPTSIDKILMEEEASIVALLPSALISDFSDEGMSPVEERRVTG